MLTYHGKPVTPYNYCHYYNTGDYVIESGVLYKSLQDCNAHIFPDLPNSCFRWEKIGIIDNTTNEKQKKQEKEMKIIRGNHIGSIFGDNVVIYGDNEGDISASGEKSVIVVFGNVTGNITADRVIRLDNTNMDAVKAMILKKQGDNHA